MVINLLTAVHTVVYSINVKLFCIKMTFPFFFLLSLTVQEILIASLDSDSREVVYICCGVLVNFMADREKRPILRKEGGIQK